MKRILALVLVFSIFLGTFSGCSWFKGKEAQPTEEPAVATDPTETTPEVDEKLDKALEYLRVFYKNAAEKTPMDYKRLGQVRIGTSVYDIVWSVDVDETLIDHNFNGIMVYDVEKMADYIRENGIEIGVIAARRRVAQQLADIMVEAGIRAIWNFVPITVTAPVPVENVHLSDSMYVLSYRMHEG